MAQYGILAPKEQTGELPVVRSITPVDLKKALLRGLADFKAMPTHVIFLAMIYPVVGILIMRATFHLNIIPVLFPIASGFALIGPVAAIGLYELSRRRERGMDTSWIHAFDVFHSPSLKAIVALSLMLLTIFVVWIVIAQSLYISNFGYSQPTSIVEFINAILTTPAGHNLIILGNSIGFLFAVLVFVLNVVSFPLLLDRNVGTTAAIITSVKTVTKNPFTMALWGLIIAVGLVLGSLPFFFGLAIVLPILGHATWHLYRAVIEPDANPRPEYNPRPFKPSYAADFPASLFSFIWRDRDEDKN